MAASAANRMKVERFVEERIVRLQDQLLIQKRPVAKAQLARLRRVAAMPPGESPEVWELEFAQLPESLAGTGAAQATEGEWAVHLALALYATHQQSQNAGMFVRTNKETGELHGLGDGVRRLAYANQTNGEGEQLSQGEMPRRFKALVTAESIAELAHYARQLVAQLRSASIPLDYARLAGQLYDFQHPYLRSRVRLEWAREFARRDPEARDQVDVTQDDSNEA
ncbi:MAG: type I-E CRISPR-associated protein Cse2/CasB [Atopobiaceae bacterium]|nr:type I-E CRISPR-associated protein Cse2/CasB [Atopobiaceae bacterium]